MDNLKNKIQAALGESARVKQAAADNLSIVISEAAQAIVKIYHSGGKILIAGNGGSAADAQHLAAELMGRFRKERPGLPAIALTANSSNVTALANDYGYETVFSRQIEALAESKDLFFAISTSGNSSNIVKAAETAQKKGVTVIALTGKDGGNVSGFARICIRVPSSHVARIQEAHIAICHAICEAVEDELFA